MTGDDKVPSHILERILDKADQATAKAISDLENAITLLVTKLNTPPRIEDVDRAASEIKKLMDDCVNTDLDGIKLRMDDLTAAFIEMKNRVDGFISKTKWIAGTMAILFALASSSVYYVSRITEQTISSEVSIRLKEIEEKYEALENQREREFNRIMEEIGKIQRSQ